MVKNRIVLILILLLVLQAVRSSEEEITLMEERYHLTTLARSDNVDQESVGVYYLWQRYKNETRPAEKEKILKEIKSIELQKQHLDGIVNSIGSFLFGPKSSSILNHIRQPGEGPVVDDWECLKISMEVFQKYCGSLTDHFGVPRHSGAFANICNAGVGPDALEKACKVICNGHTSP